MLPTTRTTRRLARALVIATVATVAMLAVAGPTAAAVPPPAPLPLVSADALATPQVNGIVYSVAIVGTTAYAAGDFTTARPAGVAAGGPGTVARTNLLAFDVTTGALLPFSHTITGTPFVSATNPGGFCDPAGAVNTWVCDSVFRVKASADGKTIYIAGDFTKVDGVARNRVAAFSTAGNPAGTLTSFAPAISSRVRGLAVGTGGIYLAGSFTSAAGAPRARVAAFAPTGALLGFAPTIDASAWSAALTADGTRLVVGGQFDTADAVAQHGLAAFRTVDSTVVPWPAPPLPTGDGTAVTDLAISGNTVYASGFAYTVSLPGNLEGRMAVDIDSGATLWADGCRGDTQSLALAAGVIYSASHNHQCVAIGGWPQLTPVTYQRIVAETAAATGSSPLGLPVPSVLPLFANTDGGPATDVFKNGPWAVAADGTYLVVGGEFSTVNGAAQQGLTRFVLRSKAPRKSGPVTLGPPTAVATRPGQVTVSFQTSWDRDDTSLTYQLLRNNVQVAAITAASTFWHRPVLTWTDTGAPAGTSVSYRVRAVDGDGNALGSVASPAVVVGGGVPAPGDYAAAVLADGASHSWRLDDAAGSATAVDRVAADDLTLGADDTLGTHGAVANDPGTSMYLGGSGRSRAISKVKQAAPAQLSVESWFWTTSPLGGELAGLGSSSTGLSTTTDRVLYLTSEGRVAFGTNAALPVGVSSPLTYNDGRWHHAVATLGTAGATLYVDGRQVAADPTVTAAAFQGYWRVGGDRLAAWPGVYTSTPTGRGFPWPTSNDLAGGVDEVAVYPTALTAAQVQNHYLHGAPDAGSLPTLAGSSVRLAPTDDATVSQVNPAVGYGTAKTLSVDADGLVQNVLLRFVVPPTCTPSHAVLTLTVGTGATNGSVDGGRLAAAPGAGWADKTVTWGTAPAATGVPVAVGPVAVATAYPVDVSALVAGAQAPTSQGQQTLGFRASSPSTDGAVYASRESTTGAGPTLALTCG